MIFSDELLAKVKRYADADGISVDAFLLRCVEDTVGWREQADAEIDAADSGDAVVAPQPTTPEETRRRNVEGMRKWLSMEDPRRAAKEAVRAEEVAARKLTEESRRKNNELFLRSMRALKD